MHIHETFKRRVRIEGKLDEFAGQQMNVTDLDTGEAIWNVLGAAIYLSPGEINVAELTYHSYNEVEFGENGPIPHKKKIRLDNPEIALSCYERIDHELR